MRLAIPSVLVRSAQVAAAAVAVGLAAFPAIAQTTSGPHPFHIVPDTPAPEVAQTPEAQDTPADTISQSTPLGTADAKNVQRAKEWFTRIQNGDVDRAQLTPAFDTALTDSIVAQMSALLKPYGDPVAFEPGGKFVQNGVSAYLFRVSWAEGGVLYQFALDDATGKVAGIFTRPAPPRSITK